MGLGRWVSTRMHTPYVVGIISLAASGRWRGSCGPDPPGGRGHHALHPDINWKACGHAGAIHKPLPSVLRGCPKLGSLEADGEEKKHLQGIYEKNATWGNPPGIGAVSPEKDVISGKLPTST